MLGRYPQLAYLIQCFAGPLPHRTLSDRLFSASLRTMTAISLAFGDLPEISYRYILGDLPEKYDRYMPGLPYSGASLRTTTTAAYCCYLGPPIKLTYLKRTDGGAYLARLTYDLPENGHRAAVLALPEELA